MLQYRHNYNTDNFNILILKFCYLNLPMRNKCHSYQQHTFFSFWMRITQDLNSQCLVQPWVIWHKYANTKSHLCLSPVAPECHNQSLQKSCCSWETQELDLSAPVSVSVPHNYTCLHQGRGPINCKVALILGFHRPRPSYDHHIWAYFRGCARQFSGNFYWSYMWPRWS